VSREVTAATITPAYLWKDCKLQTVPDPTAIQTAVCMASGSVPDRWQLSTYRTGADLAAAYNAELKLHYRGKCGSGTVLVGRRDRVAARTGEAREGGRSATSTAKTR